MSEPPVVGFKVLLLGQGDEIRSPMYAEALWATHSRILDVRARCLSQLHPTQGVARPQLREAYTTNKTNGYNFTYDSIQFARVPAPVPDERCSCGIYMVNRLIDLDEYLFRDHAYSFTLITKVAGYGKVIDAERGHRVEKAHILSFVLPYYPNYETLWGITFEKYALYQASMRLQVPVELYRLEQPAQIEPTQLWDTSRMP